MKTILEQLRNEPGTLAKLDILKDCTPWDKRMFLLAYHPQRTYGLTFADNDIELKKVEKLTLIDLTLLGKLEARELRGLTARNKVEAHCRIYGDLVKLICNRDLQCGVTATSINKVFPKFIPVFKVQLAKEVPLDKLEYPIYAQLKSDGVRVVVTIDNNRVMFRTRNGKELLLPKMRAKLLEQKLGRYLMLDTEVTLIGGTTEDRTTVSGMLNSARQGSVIDESKLQFNVFDAMPLSEFNNQECSLPYYKRITMVLIECEDLSAQFEPLPVLLVNNPKEVNAYFKKVLAKGQEGLILKPINHKYTFKRSKDWVKVKAILDCDLLCTGWLEGTGRLQGLLGAITCEGAVEGKAITVNVGTGFTDLNRHLIDTDVLGKTIEIKYNGVIQDSVSKQWSLFLPRFVAIREDK